MNKLEIGAWNKLPHFAVVGSPVEFYIWINTGRQGGSAYVPGIQGACGWIRGKYAFELYNKLSVARKDRCKFIQLCKDSHSKIKRTT